MIEAPRLNEVLIQFDNASAQVYASPDVITLLRYDLCYLADKNYAPVHRDELDGFIRVLDVKGNTYAGMVPMILRLLDKYKIPYRVVDKRVKPMDDLPLFSRLPAPREYQSRLVDRALTLCRGVIDSPPRSGKTNMAMMMIDQNPLRTVYIAPTKGIVHQTWRSMSNSLALYKDDIVELTGGWPKSPKQAKALLDRRVVITTAATAAKSPESFWRTRDRLIVDEFHHSGANSYHIINNLARNVYHRIGLTGTHFRSDENSEILMDCILAEKIGTVSVQSLIDLGFLTPVDFCFIPVMGPVLEGKGNHDITYKQGITRHQRRNEWAAYAAKALLARGKKVIVLVKLVEHGEKLAGMIPDAKFVKGAGEDLTDEEVRASIADFNKGETKCLIGTSVLGEGIDLPAADALIYAKGGSAAVTVTQDFYRVLTASEGKKRAIVVDFADRHHPSLLAQSVSRGRIYSQEDAFNVSVLGNPLEFDEWLEQRMR